MSPAEFIPLAEETGLIKDIGDWVFKQAAQQAKSWRETYNPNFQISVNKSPVQFNSGSNNAGHTWCAYLAKLNLQGQGIVIEITESVLMKSDDWIKDNLLFFRDAGIQVALDDFGTGYSSLAYLKKFDIDYIKIDQSFVRHLKSGSDDLTLCKAIIVMAHTLGIKVIAEGVETQTQLELLQSIDCDYAQGYLFSKPIPTNEFEQLLLTNLDKPFTEN
ncbi:MAG: EAL domain-containing protein [Gammaproteobacteria bacterium]|nr:EAL domain-containing protein [Gammaproteobacteria bacterium]